MWYLRLYSIRANLFQGKHWIGYTWYPRISFSAWWVQRFCRTSSDYFVLEYSVFSGFPSLFLERDEITSILPHFRGQVNGKSFLRGVLPVVVEIQLQEMQFWELHLQNLCHLDDWLSWEAFPNVPRNLVSPDPHISLEFHPPLDWVGSLCRNRKEKGW